MKACAMYYYVSVDSSHPQFQATQFERKLGSIALDMKPQMDGLWLIRSSSSKNEIRQVVANGVPYDVQVRKFLDEDE